MSTIWIDFENTPHVPFFAPIIARLEARGHKIILTSRDFAQTDALVRKYGFQAVSIGREHGSSTLRKSIGIAVRALRLANYLRGKGVSFAVGHGSRGLVLGATILRIPSMTFYDYEGANTGLFDRLSRWVMTPEVLGKALLESQAIDARKLLMYPGMKEEVYVSWFAPNEKIYDELQLDPKKIIITVRPPSETAHYRSKESETLFYELMQLLKNRDDVELIISARTHAQKSRFATAFASWSNLQVPGQAFDGLNLLYHSDLVIGGGGTMNREAAALGVPVASIFKGVEGAIDHELVRTNKMVELSQAPEILPMLSKRIKQPIGDQPSSKGLDVIVEAIDLRARAEVR